MQEPASTHSSLIFATHNNHKLEEVSQLIGSGIKLLSLTDMGIHDEIEENGDSFEENALIKSKFIYKQTGKNCFSDDSGLVIDSLAGAPGIFSARYGGSRDMKKNLELVLHNMVGQVIRTAHFICVICLMVGDEPVFFSGKIEGVILNEPMGHTGFGYDPIFRPDGYELSFAQMDAGIKNTISHRALAMQALNTYLRNHYLL